MISFAALPTGLKLNVFEFVSPLIFYVHGGEGTFTRYMELNIDRFESLKIGAMFV